MSEQDSSQTESAEDPRLLEAVRQYLADLEAGRQPNRRALLAQYPDIATELSACLQSLNFVNQAAEQLAATAQPTQLSDDQRALGDFRLIREIGRGGMGVVYEAQQLSLDRRVAVKVLSMAAALDARHLQRFRNEAQAAAQLHHTNIVPVYAVGCERSVHFYAMQLIDGQSVADIIAAMRDSGGGMTSSSRSSNTGGTAPLSPSPGTPGEGRGEGDFERTTVLVNRNHPHPNPLPDYRERGSSHRHPTSSNRITPLTTSPSLSLSTLHSRKRSDYFRRVATLGVQAARALEYAHTLGVVHRDIKPANLLIDIRGNLWITDFGLAQFYNATDNNLTQSGDLLGTVRYMSPEQAAGRGAILDQRTDVYSLGITLYEMVTLQRALPGESRQELLNQVQQMDPRPPRSIDRSIPPELQTILAKATAKDASDRYPSAKALADDLQRYLDDNPIRARPPSLWDKSIKWTRRHRALAIAAILVLAITAAALLISTILIAREQANTAAAYKLEQQNARAAMNARQRAQASYEEARRAVDTLTQVAAAELPRDPSSHIARRHLLEVALAYYQQLLDSPSQSAAQQADLQSAQQRASSLLAELAATDRMFRLRYNFRLLRQDPIQRELNLQPMQAQHIAQLAESLPAEEFLPPGDQTTSANRHTPQELQQLTDHYESALTALLTPQQLIRLQQLSRQFRGPAAFDDPDVAAALALTDQQKLQIHQAQLASLGPGPHDQGPLHSPDGPMWGPPDEPGPPRRNTPFISRAMLAILTPTQQKIWQSLTGQPFNHPIDLFPDHPMGPPPQ